MIREAEPKDLPVILDIMNEAILNSTTVYDYAPKTMEFVEDWFQKKHLDKAPVLVYEMDRKTVAYGTYGRFRPRDAYRFSVEHSIYVHKDFRGAGTGTQLLAELIKRAKEEGYHTMIAGIDAANEKSYEFHRKMGFVEAGRVKEVGYKFDTWLDLIFMQLMLKKDRT
ncbi:MAG TPA: GNAT family N-acetyltransferase [Puia sp.]|nr:GNAT family N-acetyltransferase [Puia sp.]